MRSLDHDAYMQRAIEASQDNRYAPFGAVLVDGRDDRVVATGCNCSEHDPTMHGEIDCIRNAIEAIDPDRKTDYVLYTTAEPCPMCMSACIWAGYGGVVYGTSIPHLVETGWFQIDLRAAQVADRADWETDQVIGGVLEAECDALFDAAIAHWR